MHGRPCRAQRCAPVEVVVEPEQQQEGAMLLVKRIVCLANSRKYAGHCVAGKNLDRESTGQWIRPVSERPFQAVSWDERQYRDGSEPRVLDIIALPVKNSQPNSYQSENWLVDPERHWAYAGTLSWRDLHAFAETPLSLWRNGSNTTHGLNDRVLFTEAKTMQRSLYLIGLAAISVRVFAPGVRFGETRRRVQASFTYRDVPYRLWITDPVLEQRYRACDDGVYPIGPCFATISLGEPVKDGYCYKLVAAIIERGMGD